MKAMVSILLAVVLSTAATATDEVSVNLSLYRIRGDISGETSLTDNIWEGVSDEAFLKQRGPYTFFTVPNLTVAGVKLTAGEKGWLWDGQGEPPAKSRVEKIASPRLLVAVPQACEVFVGSDAQIQYFARRADGLFELKAVRDWTGLKVAMSVENGSSERILLKRLLIQMQTVEQRLPIEGVQLDVGEPIIKKRVHEISVAVKPDQEYGIMLPTEGMGSLLLRLKVSHPKKE